MHGHWRMQFEYGWLCVTSFMQQYWRKLLVRLFSFLFTVISLQTSGKNMPTFILTTTYWIYIIKRRLTCFCSWSFSIILFFVLFFLLSDTLKFSICQQMYFQLDSKNVYCNKFSSFFEVQICSHVLLLVSFFLFKSHIFVFALKYEIRSIIYCNSKIKKKEVRCINQWWL